MLCAYTQGQHNGEFIIVIAKLTMYTGVRTFNIVCQYIVIYCMVTTNYMAFYLHLKHHLVVTYYKYVII